MPTASSSQGAGSAAGLRRRAHDESGQSIVEFALVVPLICAIVLVLVDFGKAMNYWLDLNRVANEGARLAVVSPTPPQAGPIQARLLSNELRNDPSTKVTFPNNSCAVGDPVTVEITSDYHWFDFPDWIPIAGGGVLTIKGRAEMRRERAC